MLGTRDDHRSVLSEAVVPPPDHVFDEGVITTYSLDLRTLLTLPVHLVLADPSNRDQLFENEVAILDSLRRARDRISVFCEQGRMLAPKGHHVLYSLLEPVIHEVLAPHGAFHPKLWVLKFRPISGEGPAIMRALVLSRNLTEDRSWDLALRLDGQITTTPQTASEPLQAFLGWLEKRPATSAVSAKRLSRMALEVGRTEWEIPAPFDWLSFAVLGTHPIGSPAKKWMPGGSDRSSKRLVISPFVDNGALNALLDNTARLERASSDTGEERAVSGPLALISRPEQLERIDPALLHKFGGVYVLKEHVETEDGE